jgi:hypothetical protein
MPGQFTVDTRRTFALVILMGSGPKIEFQSTAQAVTANGEKRWEVQCAATWLADPGRRPVSEVITITIDGGDKDPADAIPVGSPIELEGLRVGVSSPERTDKGVRGGRAWYQAERVRAVPAPNGRPLAAAKAD